MTVRVIIITTSTATGSSFGGCGSFGSTTTGPRASRRTRFGCGSLASSTTSSPTHLGPCRRTMRGGGSIIAAVSTLIAPLRCDGRIIIGTTTGRSRRSSWSTRCGIITTATRGSAILRTCATPAFHVLMEGTRRLWIRFLSHVGLGTSTRTLTVTRWIRSNTLQSNIDKITCMLV